VAAKFGEFSKGDLVQLLKYFLQSIPTRASNHPSHMIHLFKMTTRRSCCDHQSVEHQACFHLPQLSPFSLSLSQQGYPPILPYSEVWNQHLPYLTHTIRKQQFHSRELATRTGTSLVFSIMIRLGYRATQPKTANKVKPRVLLLMCFLSLAAIGQSKGSQWPLNTSTPRLEIESDWWITGECKVTSQVVCFPSFEIALMTILVEVTSKH